MTPKRIALINVSKLVGLAVLVGAVTTVLLMHVPLAYLGIGACVVVMLVLVHMIYEVELSKAEHLAALNKMK
jgi:hypothetical protein